MRGDAALSSRIRAKYRIKNTTGYSLNALLDFERPVDIFAHLLVGAEGTLAFIAEAVLAHGARPAGEVHGAAALPDDPRRRAPRSSRCATPARRRSR